MKRLGGLAAAVLETALEVLVAKLDQIADDTAEAALDWYARGYASGYAEGLEQVDADADQEEQT